MKIVRPLDNYDYNRESIKALQDELLRDYPVRADLLLGVDYDSKTNHYVAKLGYFGDKKNSVRVSNELAEFLLKLGERRGALYLKMEKGTAVDGVFYSYD